MKALPAANRDELDDRICRPVDGKTAPAPHPEAWVIAPPRIDALLVGRDRLQAAIVA